MKEINIGQATAITSPDPLVLVCTAKEDGGLNMAPVSFFMYASFNPPMLAFAMGKAANSGENIRRTGRAVLAAPGISLKDAVMAYGSANGGKTDKLKEMPIALQSIEGSDIPELLLSYLFPKLLKRATTTCIFAILTKLLQMIQKRPCLHGKAMQKWLRRRKNKQYGR